jgi:hypothetical protein
MFISGYFPLALIFIIQDLDRKTYLPQHPHVAGVVCAMVTLSVIIVLIAAVTMKDGLPLRITKVTNKSGDMFAYAIPYMLSVGKFNFGDWQTLSGIVIFLAMMFLFVHRAQAVLVNPVLALAGYGLYDCQFKDGAREAQALIISKHEFQSGDTCIVRRLSSFLYFVTSVPTRRDHVD